jgi:hypothetical protein
MSQIRPDAPLFYHGQDHIASKKLSVLRNKIGTGITVEEKT